MQTNSSNTLGTATHVAGALVAVLMAAAPLYVRLGAENLPTDVGIGRFVAACGLVVWGSKLRQKPVSAEKRRLTEFLPWPRFSFSYFLSKRIVSMKKLGPLYFSDFDCDPSPISR